MILTNNYTHAAPIALDSLRIRVGSVGVVCFWDCGLLPPTLMICVICADLLNTHTYVIYVH